MIPVSTSPLPPLDNPLHAREFTHALPSGAAITVSAPFSSSVTPYSCANPFAAFSRSDCICATLSPVMRLNSSGCGVRIVSPVRSFSTSIFPAMEFMPSASIITGHAARLMTNSVSLRVFSLFPSPQPTITAEAISNFGSTISSSTAESTSTNPSGVSGSGTYTASWSPAAIIFTALTGLTAKYSPTPLRRAELAHIYAAPL